MALARDSRQATASEAPTTRDHWHEAFAVNVCGEFLDPPTDDGPDRLGIHTHGDGLIHLHPYGAGATGDNATMAVFFKQIGTVVENGTMTLKDGTTKKDGQECDGKKAEVALFVWPPQASAKTKPEKLTGDDIANYRFAENGTASVLSFNPDGFTPPLPPSMSELANPSDVEPGQSTDGLNSATSSTVAGAVTTTTAAEATTTAAPAKTTTTKPG